MHRSTRRTQTPCTHSPPEFAQAPELAVLGVLEVALDVGVSALFAEHPTLLELAESREPASLRCARQVFAAIQPLQRALQRYRAAVLEAMSAVDDVDDDLPF